jgi:hypothetical protein
MCPRLMTNATISTSRLSKATLAVDMPSFECELRGTSLLTKLFTPRSTKLHRNFSNMVYQKVKKMGLPDGSRTAGKVYRKAMSDFQHQIQHEFCNDGKTWLVDVGLSACFPDASIQEGYLILTNEEVHQCFEPVAERIEELMLHHLAAVEARAGRRVKVWSSPCIPSEPSLTNRNAENPPNRRL